MQTILITSGGTKCPIDSVRDITNMSSGNFGSKIAIEFLKRLEAPWHIVYLGADKGKHPLKMEVDFTENNEQLDAKKQRDLIDFYFFAKQARKNFTYMLFRNYDDYATKLEQLINAYKPVLTILAAAVSDYVVENPVDGKIRSSDDMTIKLKPADKLISKVKTWNPNGKLVGFKLLVDSTREELIAAAEKSIQVNDCDMVVVNDLSDIKKNNHTIRMVYPNNKVTQAFVGKGEYLAETVALESLKLVGKL